MTPSKEVQVKWLIVHILDLASPVYSQMTIPLSQWPDLENYFADHIYNSWRDPAAKAADFLDGSISGGICRSLLKSKNEADFVEGSAKLAQGLQRTIGRDKRISRGDFAVCLYHTQDKPDMPLLALMKIDPSQVYKHELKVIDGKRYVSFSVVSDAMPTTREKLQKCAFIQPMDHDTKPKFEMMVLDRQVKQLVGTTVAQFFIKDFLEAHLALDEKDRTRFLYRGLTTAQKILREKGKLSTSEDEYLNRAIDDAVAKKEINIDNWLKEMSLSDEQKETIDSVVSEILPDREFAIDPKFAKEKLIPWDRFQGDCDLRVEIPAACFGQVIRVLDPAPGKPNKKQIIIETIKWERLP